MEAAQQQDEWNRADRTGLPPGAILGIDREAPAPDDVALGKVERALLDFLAGGEARIETILDALPDFDAEIVTALQALREAGRVSVRA
jgi:hypothetical protein